MAASVATKASMVAMSGAIMPEPLQKPLMVTVTSPIFACRVASFGKVSVVMIAAAPAAQPSAFRSLMIAGRLPVILSSGSGSPITPVEARNTSLGLHFRAATSALEQRSTEATPALPVKALALPELTRMARALPPLRFLRQRSTGAERVSDLVSTPAMVVPGANSISITSVRFL